MPWYRKLLWPPLLPVFVLRLFPIQPWRQSATPVVEMFLPGKRSRLRELHWWSLRVLVQKEHMLGFVECKSLQAGVCLCCSGSCNKWFLWRVYNSWHSCGWVKSISTLPDCLLKSIILFLSNSIEIILLWRLKRKPTMHINSMCKCSITKLMRSQNSKCGQQHHQALTIKFQGEENHS